MVAPLLAVHRMLNFPQLRYCLGLLANSTYQGHFLLPPWMTSQRTPVGAAVERQKEHRFTHCAANGPVHTAYNKINAQLSSSPHLHGEVTLGPSL